MAKAYTSDTGYIWLKCPSCQETVWGHRARTKRRKPLPFRAMFASAGAMLADHFKAQGCSPFNTFNGGISG